MGVKYLVNDQYSICTFKNLDCKYIKKRKGTKNAYVCKYKPTNRRDVFPCMEYLFKGKNKNENHQRENKTTNKRTSTED